MMPFEGAPAPVLEFDHVGCPVDRRDRPEIPQVSGTALAKRQEIPALVSRSMGGAQGDLARLAVLPSSCRVPLSSIANTAGRRYPALLGQVPLGLDKGRSGGLSY